jgi:hypothetical protein
MGKSSGRERILEIRGKWKTEDSKGVEDRKAKNGGKRR